MFHGVLASILLKEVTSIKDMEGSAMCTLISTERNLQLEFVNESAKKSFIRGIRSYCNLAN